MIVAVYNVLGDRSAVGVNVAVDPEYVTVPATAAPPGAVTKKVDELTVEGFIDWLKVAVITWATGTAVAPFAGLVESTTGTGLTVCSRPQPHRKLPRNKAIVKLRAHILLISYSFICAPFRLVLMYVSSPLSVSRYRRLPSCTGLEFR